MGRAAAVALVFLVMVWVRRAAPEGAETRGAALALGFALIAAAVTGALFERARLPRISGYLLFGLACGPYVADLISRPMARSLQLVNGLAIALIAFVAGLEMNLLRLRPQWRAILRLGGVTLAFVYAVIFAVLWAAWPLLPIWPEATGLPRLAVSALATTVVVSFSPTVTIAVIAESRARGRLTSLVLALVVITDLALILLFTLAMQFARWALGGTAAEEVALGARLAWEILGSFAFGAIVGAAFAVYLRLVGRELTVVLLAVCGLLSVLGDRLHFEPLLAALAAGLVVENVAPPSGDALKDAVERGALPVLILFFAAAGASMHVDALATVGLVALAVSAVRMAAVRAGVALGSRAAGLSPPLSRLVWMGLVSQAGVTLGLTILVAAEFADWGATLQTLMVALIALHELIGPILFRTALARAGEIGRMDAPEEAAPA
ncbi:MAG TPA: cation:proton antiporter [Vicinamibacteria bacterium]